MYNNEVTYNDKWNMPENLNALKKLSKYLVRSTCASDCPTSWAPEVLDLLSKLDSKLGIARNTASLRGYRCADKLEILKGLLLISFVTCFLKNVLHHAKNSIMPNKYYIKRPIKKIIYYCYRDAVMNGIVFPLESFVIKFVNPVLNKIFKPKLYLGQVKEKYGELIIYFSTEEHLESYVEKEIIKTRVLLSKKGAYYSLDRLWNMHRIEDFNSEHNPEDYEVEINSDGSKSVKRSLYRAAIKEAGIDIKQFLVKKDQDEV